ncbi:hypothetical protein SALBM135S_09583 [Streptomyces alboniger]
MNGTALSGGLRAGPSLRPRASLRRAAARRCRGGRAGGPAVRLFRHGDGRDPASRFGSTPTWRSCACAPRSTCAYADLQSLRTMHSPEEGRALMSANCFVVGAQSAQPCGRWFAYWSWPPALSACGGGDLRVLDEQRAIRQGGQVLRRARQPRDAASCTAGGVRPGDGMGASRRRPAQCRRTPGRGARRCPGHPVSGPPGDWRPVDGRPGWRGGRRDRPGRCPPGHRWRRIGLRRQPGGLGPAEGRR